MRKSSPTSSLPHCVQSSPPPVHRSSHATPAALLLILRDQEAATGQRTCVALLAATRTADALPVRGRRPTYEAREKNLTLRPLTEA